MEKIERFVRIDPTDALPIIAQLYHQIKWLIVSGELHAGDRLPPIRKMAAVLGVHMHTIRFAYRKLEAEGLVETRQGRGTTILEYDHYDFTQHISQATSFTVGVLLPGHNPFYGPFLQGLEDAALDSPTLLFVSYTRDNPEFAQRTVKQYLAKGVDGLVLASTGHVVGNEYLKRDTNKSVPVVYADIVEAKEYSVLFDSFAAGYKATKHLFEHGHREVALLTCPLEWDVVAGVVRGYRMACTEFGMAEDPNLIVEVPDFSIQSGSLGAQKLLQLEKPPTAIFAIADMLAIGAMRALKMNGLRIPEDVALVGYNNIELASLVEPALTTVTAPAYAMGFQAMKMLQARIAGKEVKQKQIILENELIARRSCGCDFSV